MQFLIRRGQELRFCSTVFSFPARHGLISASIASRPAWCSLLIFSVFPCGCPRREGGRMPLTSACDSNRCKIFCAYWGKISLIMVAGQVIHDPLSYRTIGHGCTWEEVTPTVMHVLVRRAVTVCHQTELQHQLRLWHHGRADVSFLLLALTLLGLADPAAAPAPAGCWLLRGLLKL